MATDRDREGVLSPAEFGRALRDFLDASLALAPTEEPALLRRLREHLGVEPDELSTYPVLSRRLPGRDHPNVQIALDRLLDSGEWSAELIGLSSPFGGHEGFSLAALIAPAPQGGAYIATDGMPAAPGALEYVKIHLDAGETINCIANALLLVRRGDRALVGLLSRGEGPMGTSRLRLEAMAPGQDDAEAFLSAIDRLMSEHNVYRGRVLEFSYGEEGDAGITVRRLPEVPRERIVLPDGVLERVERHALAPARHRDRLLEAGRHLKRGLLLHGPPGTGKTLTAMHLAARMPGRTVVILTGESLEAVGPACDLARALEPAMVILEDVDLVAHERDFDDAYGSILFDLLNQMDGLAEDADVLFLLTTNRPDVLEPALAARPGRIDEAVELPLPDAAGLRRLIDLYGAGLTLRVADWDRVVEGLAGASPAHVKELLRKAALLAAEEDEGALVVEDSHLRAALEDLVIAGRGIRAQLFGERPEATAIAFPANGGFGDDDFDDTSDEDDE